MKKTATANTNHHQLQLCCREELHGATVALEWNLLQFLTANSERLAHHTRSEPQEEKVQKRVAGPKVPRIRLKFAF